MRCVSRTMQTSLEIFAILVATLTMAGHALAAGWEPTKPVEFVVPAGTGGGADQMARLLQADISKATWAKTQTKYPTDRDSKHKRVQLLPLYFAIMT